MGKAEKITLELDFEAACLLRDVIYGHGEHQAAKAPLPVFNADECEVLGAVLQTLESEIRYRKETEKSRVR